MSQEIRQFQEALLATGGVEASKLGVEGVSLGPREDRRASAIASCYSIGAHTVIFCDPELVPQLEVFGEAHPLADRACWLAWALDQGAHHLGSGVMRVRPGSASAASSTVADVVTMSADEPVDVALIHAFLDGCDEEDIDEADIDRDSLDPVIRATLGPDGAVSAFASALPWDALPSWWDIGVLTADGHRRKGLGMRCVSAVIAGIKEAGGIALYRHEAANAGSAAVAARLGFAIATQLHAVRFGSASDAEESS